MKQRDADQGAALRSLEAILHRVLALLHERMPPTHYSFSTEQLGV